MCIRARFRDVRLVVYTDSTAGKSMATRLGASKNDKRVELRYLYMQEIFSTSFASLLKVATRDNPAGLHTKSLPPESLHPHIRALGAHAPTANIRGLLSPRGEATHARQSPS